MLLLYLDTHGLALAGLLVVERERGLRELLGADLVHLEPHAQAQFQRHAQQQPRVVFGHFAGGEDELGQPGEGFIDASPVAGAPLAGRRLEPLLPE